MVQRSWSLAVATVGLLALAASPAAAQSSTKSQQDEAVRFIFQRFDDNKDGNITGAEFQKVGQQDFASFDSNKDGTVSRDEYLDPKAHGAAQLTGDQLARAKDIWGKQFDFLDADKNGKVTETEHAAAGTRSFKRLDGNKDGRITLAEMEAAAAK